jgi:GDPmannose 4,6-dehydratase
MYGNNAPMPQDETTPMRPATPYAIAKNAAFNLVKMYRDAYWVFAASGILFNHESPRRGLEFVTRKITSTVAKIKLGLAHELVLGNLDAERDWGFAGDFAEAMWLMLAQDKAEDFVIGSGEKHTVRDFVETAFDFVGLDYKKYVKSDLAIANSGPVALLSNPAKAHRVLNWKPKVNFKELVKMMVEFDLEELKRNK